MTAFLPPEGKSSLTGTTPTLRPLEGIPGGRAAAYAAGRASQPSDRDQVQAEKARVYAPVLRKNGMDWKELNAGVCKVMQDYCGEIKNESCLRLGLKWFEEIWSGEAATAFARNPHELVRVLEVFNIITNGEMIMEGCRARKAGASALGFTRSDYPELDPKPGENGSRSSRIRAM